MKFLQLSSNKSFWRGIEYHHEKRVLEWKQIDEIHYSGKVKGSDDHVYDVTIDISRPRRSKCNCPFAEGRYVVCKHMIALYLAIFPEKEKEWMDYIEEQNTVYEDERTSYMDELKEDITRYVNNLSEQEVREMLINRIFVDMLDDYEGY